MKPTDLSLLYSAAGPVLLTGGRVLVAVSHPDLDADRTDSRLVLITADGSRRDFTAGPRDSEPVLSPDGTTVAFLRAGASGPANVHVIPVDGGEARRITDHRLGASAPVFSPDGGAIAYLAAVPDTGRYGTDAKIKAEGEPPRRFTTMSYRQDGRGFVLDKPEQIFVVAAGADTISPASDQSGDSSVGASDVSPSALTAEPRGATKPAFAADGSSLIYARSTGPDDITSELVRVQLPDPATDVTAPAEPDVLVTGIGRLEMPVVAGETVFFAGESFRGNDFPGHTTGLWSMPLAGGSPRRLTDEQTVHLEPIEPIVIGKVVLIAVQNRGAVELRAVPAAADHAALDDLPVVLGGQRVVKAFAAGEGRLAAVVGDPSSFAEVVTADLDISDTGLTPTGERTVTDLGAALASTGLGRVLELNGSTADGYPVHGWLVLPQGPGPHPVLLNVHGGPHAAYTWSLFDEAQTYASAGYAVVMGNPRGSSGYGKDHGRAVVKAMGTVDVDDVLTLLDVALERDDLDSHRVGVMGGSYGGFMTSWLASHAADRFVAGISERALNAWDSFAGASDIGHFFAEAYVGADRDTQWAHSPLAYADKIDIPLLLIHSEHDWRCPLEQAQRLYTSLKLRGAEAEMVLFPAEGHELSRSGRPRHRQQRFEAILDWWQRHLPAGHG